MVSLGDFIPGVNFVSHTINNLGQGIREEGLVGAGKVLAKAYQEDIALSVAAGVATGGATVVAAEVALFGADQMGMLDLPSEAAAKAAEQAQADGYEGVVAQSPGATAETGGEIPPVESSPGDLRGRLKPIDGEEISPEKRRAIEEKIRQFEERQAKEAPVSGVPHW
jgi:hypothetical protein